MATGNDATICSGLLIRSQYFETGLRQSFTEISCVCVDSSCCKTGSTLRVAKISPANKSTGIRLMVAAAAPVIILVAPGPIEEVQTNVESRFFIFAYAAAV